MATDLNGLKRQIFFEIMEIAGRVFVLVNHHADVLIGNRGFLPEEKEKGIILVFNKRMNFQWGDGGISARLVFGSATEKCYIPADQIISVFSPELSAQFSVLPPDPAAAQARSDKAQKTRMEPPAEGKVVKVDFNKKR